MFAPGGGLPFVKLKALRDQVVVVFGGSSGIGRVTAERFAQAGAKVVIAARSEQDLAEVAAQIQHSGGSITWIAADATDFEQVRRVAGHAVATYGRLDTWVHLAAVSIYATFEETTPEEFRSVIETNLLGQIHGAKAALPHLQRQGRGALIHVSSVEARCALPYQSAYAASKHGMKGFIQALRMELEHENSGISVTEIMPSGINTQFFDKAKTKLGVKPRPVAPVYEPALVADAILYAAEHPKREIVVGGAGFGLALAERMSPRLAESALSLVAFDGQRTPTPKSAEAPHNLEHPLPGRNAARGNLGGEARSTSAYTWLATHPRAAGLAMGSLLGLAVVGRLARKR
jgi:NAD(P)-dependent dehydrogenase (short-subunit alcohol dehydrogenase family)